MAAFAMNDDCSVLRQSTKQVRLDLVLVVFRVVSRHFSTVVAPCFFDHAPFAEEVGAVQGPVFIRGFEDQTITQV